MQPQFIENFTALELNYLALIASNYLLRRSKAVGKSTRNSPSDQLELATLGGLVEKIDRMYQSALHTDLTKEPVTAPDSTPVTE